MADGENIGCNPTEDQDEDAIVSMVEVLEEQQQLVDDSNAVLGGSDSQYCTYLQGYVDRQALYVCRTCETSEPAGVCLACSLECHDGHDLVELYTKRKFRCDCGNEKFVNLKCKLCPEKVSKNIDNKYNQNFNGVYCICSRPYPDPDSTADDTMIQCMVCEDWFHSRHLSSETVIHEESFDEMICSSCMKEHPFLRHYQILSQGGDGLNDVCIEISDDGDVDVESDNSHDAIKSKLRCRLTKVISGRMMEPLKPTLETEKVEVHEAESVGLDLATNSGPVFWQSSWRQLLCRCIKCNAMYKTQDISFLLEESDSISAYEKKGKEKAAVEPYQQGLDALSKLDHVPKLEMLKGYSDLKSELSTYLKKFADNKKVVREEDITEFFTQMEARKRQKPSTSHQ